MAELLEVDGLPVELNKTQAKRVAAGESEAVADEVRALRRQDDPQSGTWDRPASFDDVTREHGEP